MVLVRSGGHLGGASRDLLPRLTFTAPAFNWQTLVGIAAPLYVITMASQNIPELALLRHFGYRPPVGPVLTATGLSTAATSLGGDYRNQSAVRRPSARW
jgi:benzoate membrane transport protein